MLVDDYLDVFLNISNSVQDFINDSDSTLANSIKNDLLSKDINVKYNALNITNSITKDVLNNISKDYKIVIPEDTESKNKKKK